MEALKLAQLISKAFDSSDFFGWLILFIFGVLVVLFITYVIIRVFVHLMYIRDDRENAKALNHALCLTSGFIKRIDDNWGYRTLNETHLLFKHEMVKHQVADQENLHLMDLSSVIHTSPTHMLRKDLLELRRSLINGGISY